MCVRLGWLCAVLAIAVQASEVERVVDEVTPTCDGDKTCPAASSDAGRAARYRALQAGDEYTSALQVSVNLKSPAQKDKVDDNTQPMDDVVALTQESVTSSASQSSSIVGDLDAVQHQVDAAVDASLAQTAVFVDDRRGGSMLVQNFAKALVEDQAATQLDHTLTTMLTTLTRSDFAMYSILAMLLVGIVGAIFFFSCRGGAGPEGHVHEIGAFGGSERSLAKKGMSAHRRPTTGDPFLDSSKSLGQTLGPTFGGKVGTAQFGKSGMSENDLSFGRPSGMPPEGGQSCFGQPYTQINSSRSLPTSTSPSAAAVPALTPVEPIKSSSDDSAGALANLGGPRWLPSASIKEKFNRLPAMRHNFDVGSMQGPYHINLGRLKMSGGRVSETPVFGANSTGLMASVEYLDGMPDGDKVFSIKAGHQPIVTCGPAEVPEGARGKDLCLPIRAGGPGGELWGTLRPCGMSLHKVYWYVVGLPGVWPPISLSTISVAQEGEYGCLKVCLYQGLDHKPVDGEHVAEARMERDSLRVQVDSKSGADPLLMLVMLAATKVFTLRAGGLDKSGSFGGPGAYQYAQGWNRARSEGSIVHSNASRGGSLIPFG